MARLQSMCACRPETIFAHYAQPLVTGFVCFTLAAAGVSRAAPRFCPPCGGVEAVVTGVKTTGRRFIFPFPQELRPLVKPAPPVDAPSSRLLAHARIGLLHEFTQPYSVQQERRTRASIEEWRRLVASRGGLVGRRIATPPGHAPPQPAAHEPHRPHPARLKTRRVVATHANPRPVRGEDRSLKSMKRPPPQHR